MIYVKSNSLSPKLASDFRYELSFSKLIFGSAKANEFV